MGDGHFVEPVTIGPIVLESIADLVHEREGVLDCHLMVDNPERHSRRLRARAATASPSTPRCGDERALIELAREHGLGVGVAFNPGTAGPSRRPPRRRRRPGAVHEHPPGLLGAGVHAGVGARIGELRRSPAAGPRPG